ncbi:MAG: hypothetical protein K2X87_09325 [Gemmataceae bacterium]|nr:hypothetical protein [Gemmataceae bacterium]
MTTREDATKALLKLGELYRAYCVERWGQESDDSVELMAVVQAYTARVEGQWRWRSIKGEVPEAGKATVFLAADGATLLSRTELIAGSYVVRIDDGLYAPLWHFTHWMPLPATEGHVG